MTKIYDVAQRAGVAKSTVSNVLTGKKFVSEDLKAKVLKACEELDYVPNFYASSLSRKKSNIIAILLEKKADMEQHPFYGELVISALLKAAKKKYSVLLYADDNLEQILKTLKHGSAPIDGAILMAPNIDDKRLKDIQNNSIECVIIGRPGRGIRLDYIDVDNYNLIREICTLLFENYTKTFLFNSKSKMTITIDRKEGFYDYLEEKGLNASDYYVEDLEGTFEEGYKLGMLYAEKDAAFITCNSLMATGLYKAIKEKGLKVGQDVGVFSLGKSQTDYKFEPTLTYAQQDYKIIGKKAVEMLINKFEHKDTTHCLLIKSKIKIRESIRHSN